MAITPRSRPPLLDDQQLPPREPENHSLPEPESLPPPASAASKIPIWTIPAFVALATGIFAATHVAAAKSRSAHAAAGSPFDAENASPTSAPTMEAGIPGLPKFEDEGDLGTNGLGDDEQALDEFVKDHCILYGSTPDDTCLPLASPVRGEDFPNISAEFVSRAYSEADGETTFTYNVCSLEEAAPVGHVTIGHLGPCCVTRNSYFGSTTVGGLDTMTCTFGLSMDTAFTEPECQIYTISYLGDVPESKEDISVALGVGVDKFLSQQVVGADCRPPFVLPIEDAAAAATDNFSQESGGVNGGPAEAGDEFDFESMFGDKIDPPADTENSGEEFDFESMFGGEDPPAAEKPAPVAPLVTKETPGPEPSGASSGASAGGVVPVESLPGAPAGGENSTSSGGAAAVVVATPPALLEDQTNTTNATAPVAVVAGAYRGGVAPVVAMDTRPLTNTALHSEAYEDCIPKSDISYQSKSNQDEALTEIYFSNPYKCGGVVVEIGSHHKHSASFYFEYAMGWKAMLVDASPRTAKEFTKKRPSATVLNGAFCTTPTGPSSSQDSLTWVQGAKEIDDAFVKSKGTSNTVFSEGTSEAGTSGETVSVPCMSLSDELTKAGHSHIDVLFISVSGEPYAVLKALDLDKISMSLLVVEKNPASSRHYEDMYNLLTESGYVKAEWDIKRWCSATLGSCADNEVWIEKGYNPLPIYGSSNGRRLLEVLEAKPRLYDPITGRRNNLRTQ